ncbi:hypothetical protein I5M32_06560 [Pedobacter sp. SD-b]|uniref:RteC protein n=1 Tax=Pedobacter segetis TaxID=2793069 RepID=A0ABS1BI98_9SPHI|nr:hypothetical protein [Pedobacter segetis]MBK0382621.1 hypothetical protein [Pedobacter segetis]
MDSPKLAELKKELNHLEIQEVKEICLRLAKYKTENKELLHYLLFYQDKKEVYVEDIKQLIINEFDDLHPSIYYVNKQLRKLIRIMNKHIKYIGEKDKECDIILCFCDEFIKHPIVTVTQQSLILLLFRQLKRAKRILPKLNEDLQFDYQQQFDSLIDLLKSKRKSFRLVEIE